jgi:CHAT domain-containing protein
MRIRLHMDLPELMVVPWELIFDEEYLGLQLRFPIVRYLDLPTAPRPMAVTPPLRVLVAVSQPKDARELDVSSELGAIQSALARSSEKVVLDVFEAASCDELLSRLRQGYHVLHYIGHGAFNGHEGYLILEDAEGRADPVSASLLGQIVAGSSLRLAVLNACETATHGLQNPFGGLAHQLAKSGMPAVLAMQGSISDAAARAFSREFYGALADGWRVEAAVQEGRRAIMAMRGNHWNESLDWALPTLHMRAPNGVML